MLNTSLVELLRAHLSKEGLVLSKKDGRALPLDGLDESQALLGIVEMIDDAINVDEWNEADNRTTTVTVTPAGVLATLKVS